MVHSHHADVAKPRVLALLPDPRRIGAVTFVRITGPLAYLKEAGYPVDWLPMAVITSMTESAKFSLGNYDLFVIPRVGDRTRSGKVAELFKLLSDLGRAVVWETDDDYTNEYRDVLDGDANSVMDSATALIVSTPHLREQCRKYTDKPIYLLQNTIDFRFWDAVPKTRLLDKITVGLVGTRTHYDDWLLAKDALYRIAEDYPDVHFVTGGYCPSYLEELPRMLALPPVRYGSYPSMIHQIDIGLCPLVPDDLFNKSKSAIKALEYWAGGAAVVASDCSVYDRVVDKGRGFLATTTEDWYTAISKLIEQPELRKQEAAAGRAWTEKWRNMKKNAPFWWDVYTEVYAKHGGKINVSSIARRTVGLRAADSKGRSRNHVLPVSRPPRRRRSRHHH